MVEERRSVSRITAVGMLAAAGLAVFGLLRGCEGQVEAYTLYRNPLLDKAMRIHVATFDATGPEAYNQENCALAQKLFAGQEGVTVAFWCEKGRYRP